MPDLPTIQEGAIAVAVAGVVADVPKRSAELDLTTEPYRVGTVLSVRQPE